MVIKKALKNPLLLIIIAILVFIILVSYGIGLEVANPDDNPLEIIKKGFDTIVASILPEAETPSEEDEDDEDDDDISPEWNQKVEVTGGSTVDGGGMSHEFFGCGFTVGAFSPSDSGNIRITFSYSWYPDGCTSPECEPGVVWCLHDSLGTQIYHSIVPNQGSYGPYNVMGVWNGVDQWEVRIGNNCPCPIHTSWTLRIDVLE